MTDTQLPVNYVYLRASGLSSPLTTPIPITTATFTFDTNQVGISMTLTLIVGTFPAPFFKVPIISIKGTNFDFSAHAGTNIGRSDVVITASEIRFRSTTPSQLELPSGSLYSGIRAFDRAEPATLTLTVYDGDEKLAMASSPIAFNYVPRNLNDLTIVSSSTILGSTATLTLSYTPTLTYRTDAQLRLTMPTEVQINAATACSTTSITASSCTVSSSRL